MKSLAFLPLLLAVSSATIQDLTYPSPTKSSTTANAGKIAAADAAAASSSMAALASVASLFAAEPSPANPGNQYAAASLAQSIQIASIASMFAASPTGNIEPPLATAPLGTAPLGSGASVIPPASRVPAIPAAPKATVVKGQGTNANGDSCACQCACGAMPIAKGSRAGMGAFGGMVGQLPAVGAMAKGSG